MTKRRLVEIREEEQRNANRVLGIKETVFLRQSDGMLQPTLDLRRAMTRIIRQYQPDAVVVGDPTVRFYGNSYMNHPDHRVVGDVALDAVFPSAGTRLIFPELLAEGFEPHEVKKVYIHGAEKPDTFVDISDTMDTKIAALREHKSQVGHWDVDKQMREWAGEDGKKYGVQYAESYRVMILVEEGREEKKEEAEAKV